MPRPPLLARCRTNMSNSFIHLVLHDPSLTPPPAHPMLLHVLGRTYHRIGPRERKTSLTWPICNLLCHTPRTHLAHIQPLNPSADPYRLKTIDKYHNNHLHNFIDPDHLIESAAKVVVCRWPLTSQGAGLRSPIKIINSLSMAKTIAVSQRKACWVSSRARRVAIEVRNQRIQRFWAKSGPAKSSTRTERSILVAKSERHIFE